MKNIKTGFRDENLRRGPSVKPQEGTSPSIGPTQGKRRRDTAHLVHKVSRTSRASRASINAHLVYEVNKTNINAHSVREASRVNKDLNTILLYLYNDDRFLK